MNAKRIWQTTIERLKERVSPTVFTNWFEGTSALSFHNNIFVIRVPTTFVQIQMEGRFYDLISSLLQEVIGTAVEVQFVVANNQEESSENKNGSRTSDMLAGPKRAYNRLTKGRISSALRGKRSSETLATTMNLFTTQNTPSPSTYRTPTPEVQQHEFQEETPPEPPPAPMLEQAEVPSSPAHGTVPNEPTTTTSEVGQPNRPMIANSGLMSSRYTFDTFIVGKSNQLAHAASMAVAESPGRIYNPLFLYGGVGLGKTHLLRAIGHTGESVGLTVLYTTSEKFTNEIINAIRYQKTEEFRAKYRQIDILLVDDIQFIAGKESTEEEFFHTFNTLHNANKQIVVTSDRPPKYINSLQDRLRSRFEWGLLADVQPPEYEHRLAILRSKADSLRFTIPSSVIEYIARPPSSNVRELEGALNRVIAYATLHDAPLTVSLAAKALEHIYETTKPPTAVLTVNDVLNGVCRYYTVDANLLRGKQRDRDIVWPRQVAMYLMREETSASLLQIGTALGGRDHTTIMHGWEKVNTEMANNDNVRQEIAAVLESLQSRSME